MLFDQKSEIVFEVFRVRQPGVIPSLICFFTRSKFNHLIFFDPIEKQYIGLDSVNRIERFSVLPSDWVLENAGEFHFPSREIQNLYRRIARFHYSNTDNVIAFLCFLFPFLLSFFRKRRPESLDTNCVGFVDMLFTGHLSYQTPGGWKALSTDSPDLFI